MTWPGLLSTWFGCGLSPVAPGTVGSIAAVPVHLALRRLSPLGHAAAVIALSALGIWAADRYAAEIDEKDPPSAVIDEVAGTLIALGLVRTRGAAVGALAFVLFRVFDVVKPGPIHRAQDAEPKGLGIMADDLMAGLSAGIAARLMSGWR